MATDQTITPPATDRDRSWAAKERGRAWAEREAEAATPRPVGAWSPDRQLTWELVRDLVDDEDELEMDQRIDEAARAAEIRWNELVREYEEAEKEEEEEDADCRAEIRERLTRGIDRSRRDERTVQVVLDHLPRADVLAELGDLCDDMGEPPRGAGRLHAWSDGWSLDVELAS